MTGPFEFTFEPVARPRSTGVPVASKVNPQFIVFTPSADHSVVVAGIRLVNEYRLVLTVANNPAARIVKGLGRPAPAADGLIYVPRPTECKTHVEYQPQIVTIGPGGESASGTGDGFVVTGKPTATAAPKLQ